MTEENPAEEKSKQKATTYFLVVALIVIIIILGYILFGVKPKPPAPNTVEYSYFTFTEVGGLWQTEVQLAHTVYQAIFRFNPKQVEDVYVTGKLGNLSRQIYITFDPVQQKEDYKYLALAGSELSLHLVRALEKNVTAACTSNETDACIDRTIVKCGDQGKSVIYLNPYPPTQITLNGTCVTLQGEKMELLKSVDRLLFQWYKIMR